ncbi:hypothetical protein HDU96_008835 [Phlyctochytrium bullatum]|nr:hypothetical protein HDU96_008835 [Phlyctochytrium bullatum]
MAIRIPTSIHNRTRTRTPTRTPIRIRTHHQNRIHRRDSTLPRYPPKPPTILLL